MADAALPGIAEAAAIEHLREQARRIEAAERRLGVGGVGEAQGADPPIAPGLLAQPGAGVDAVMPVREVFDEHALGSVAAAAILVDDGVAAREEGGGELGAGGGDRVGGGEFAAAGLGAAIGRAFEDDGEGTGALRQVHLGREAEAVPHRDHLGHIGAPVSAGAPR